MKKLKVLALLLMSVAFVSCSESDGQLKYEGENAVFFNQPTTTQKIILDGVSPDMVATIPFGFVTPASASSQVKLVFDAENSTAVQGVDFAIVNDMITVEAGSLGGEFEVKYFQDPAVSEGKVANFILESSAVALAVFKNNFAVTMVLSCQVDLATFPLTYDVEVYAFDEQADSHVQTFTVVTGQENSFKVNSMWGVNFVAWATGSASYAGQFVYPATIVINCDNTVDVITTGTQFLGGSGTYDPATGVIDVVIAQGVFTAPFDTNCIFYPSQP